MKIICGLGNPGAKYLRTRHNIGFSIIEKFAEGHGMSFGEKKYRGEFSGGKIKGLQIALLKPMTFMNLSGEALGEAALRLKSSMDEILVIHDDADLPLGDIRFKKGGKDNGHNGIRSIIDSLGDEHFARLRVGIGRGPGARPLIDHVLSDFDAEELPLVGQVIKIASAALDVWMLQGHQAAMNKYNRRTITTEGENI